MHQRMLLEVRSITKSQTNTELKVIDKVSNKRQIINNKNLSKAKK